MHFDRFAQYGEIKRDYSEMDITKVYETFIRSSNLRSRAICISISWLQPTFWASSIPTGHTNVSVKKI